ncbi:hypothetical protein N0V86_006915 [Didymella sp. IMI 355093]|nr:hypothetical protein N0V86_006915 [Didymella sp. IMI 355093]
MASINMINIPRPGNDMPAALAFQPGAPAKRKADAVPSNDINTTAKRQKMAPDPTNLRAPAKSPCVAKASGRPRKASAAPTNTTVANTTAQAPIPAPVPNPASFAVSSVPALAQSNTQQPPAAFAQSASQGKASKPPLPSPAYRPGACFTQALAAPITPWFHPFPAPTPRLTYTLTSCPVDWTKVPGLEPQHIEAYELRAPWNSRPMTFGAVAAQTQFLNNVGKQPAEEGVRKRFKIANISIFERTGVYFQDSSQGLEKYGVEKPAKPKKETASRSTCPSASGTSRRTTATQKVCKLHGDGEAAVYKGEIVAVQLQAPSESGPSVRICDARLIPAYDELITYEEFFDDDDEPYIQAVAPFLPFSAEAFDHWHSSVCLGRAKEFPKRTMICKEIDDGQYMLRVNSRAKKASVSLMLETYIVSQAMGTSKTSDMILTALAARLRGAPKSALSFEHTSVLRFLRSDDPVFNVVNDFKRRHARFTSSSEYNAQDDDEQL